MARMICRCGNYLDNHDVPSDVELWVYTDKEWARIFGTVKSIDPIDIPIPTYSVWKCPKCQRIYVYGEGSSPPVAVYALEPDNK